MELQQAPAGIKGTPQRAGLHRLEGAEGGRAGQHGNGRLPCQKPLPVLMDVAAEHDHRCTGLGEDTGQLGPIPQPDRIEERGADRQWRMVHHHKGGSLPAEQALTEPGQLRSAEPAPRIAAPVAGEQQQAPGAHSELSGRQHGLTTEHRLQQERVIVVPRQQRQGKAGGGEQGSEMDVATPALVLAEITADQQQIRRSTNGFEGLKETVTQLLEGGTTPVATLLLAQQVGIAELQHPQGL